MREPTTVLVLRYLRDHGPSGCAFIGTAMPNRKGRRVSASGGGDYAAQMLLGRMRKAGLVDHAPSEGSTVWRISAKGIGLLKELDHAKRRLETADFEVNHLRKEVERTEERIDCAMAAQSRAAEKQASRDADARALASGEKTVAQLRAENSAFAFPRDRIRLTLPSKR